MSYFNATPRDDWRKKRKLETDPVFAFNHHVKSSESVNPVTNFQPIESLTIDPVLRQARAEESFYSQQLSNGFEIFQKGQIEIASDEQNLRAFEENETTFSLSSDQSLDIMHDARAPSYPSIYDRPPLADPFLAPQVGPPMTPFQAIDMCLGGY